MRQQGTLFSTENGLLWGKNLHNFWYRGSKSVTSWTWKAQFWECCNLLENVGLHNVDIKYHVVRTPCGFWWGRKGKVRHLLTQKVRFASYGCKNALTFCLRQNLNLYVFCGLCHFGHIPSSPLVWLHFSSVVCASVVGYYLRDSSTQRLKPGL